MSSSAARLTPQQLKPLIRSLPPSPLSEERQFSSALEAIVNRAAASSSAASSATPSTAGSSLGNSASASFDEIRAAGQRDRLVQLRDSVMRIRSGQAYKDYPLSGSILAPPNDEHFYTRVRNAFFYGQQGISRTWWKTLLNVKGET